MNLLMKEKMDLDTFINKAAIKPGRKELYTKRLATSRSFQTKLIKYRAKKKTHAK